MSPEPTLPAAVQQIVDSVTESRRRYVGTRSINWCGYNPHGIRIAVIFPHPEGAWAIAHRYENPWVSPHAAAHDQRLRQFATVEAAQADVQTRNPTMCLTWKSEEVEQAGHEFAPVEKAS
jgi:hypothetical protein